MSQYTLYVLFVPQYTLYVYIYVYIYIYIYTCIWRITVFGVAPDLATWAPEWSIHPKNPAQGRLRPAQGTAQGTFFQPDHFVTVC